MVSKHARARSGGAVYAIWAICLAASAVVWAAIWASSLAACADSHAIWTSSLAARATRFVGVEFAAISDARSAPCEYGPALSWADSPCWRSFALCSGATSGGSSLCGPPAQ